MCLVKCRLSVVNFVECVVWWLMWVGLVWGWWQCGVAKNCFAWFVLVNVGFVKQSAFCWE